MWMCKRTRGKSSTWAIHREFVTHAELVARYLERERERERETERERRKTERVRTSEQRERER
jgi:hypothetical protein